MAQHSSKHALFFVVTANRLSDGRVVYFDEHGKWQEPIAAAQIAAGKDGKDGAQALLRRAEQAGGEPVVDVYLFALTDKSSGAPASVRETIRAKGPTVDYLPPS